MKMTIIAIVIILAAVLFMAFKLRPSVKSPNGQMIQTDKSVYDYTLTDIDGKAVNLGNFKGKVLVLVNVASKCGLTPQYEQIESFYESWKDKNVVVLGFPANNFMGQEPGSNEEIKTFCSTKYGVTFPMFSKISVKGDDMHPLYQYLTKKELNGWHEGEVSWNFQKFLINKKGEVVASFSPRTTVLEKEVLDAVNAELKK
jgi:glutathione peroxidase